MTDANMEIHRQEVAFRKALKKWDNNFTISEWQEKIGKHIESKGFTYKLHEEYHQHFPKYKALEFWRALCLIHTELSEMAEDYLIHGEITANGREELADTVIRCLDFAFRFNINLEKEMAEKMVINMSRPYRHGKKG